MFSREASSAPHKRTYLRLCMEWKLLPPPFLGLLLSGLLSPMPPAPLACNPWTEKRNGTKNTERDKKRRLQEDNIKIDIVDKKKRVLDKKNGRQKQNGIGYRTNIGGTQKTGFWDKIKTDKTEQDVVCSPTDKSILSVFLWKVSRAKG